MPWEWLIDMIQEWHFSHVFVDRGDPAAADFLKGDLTLDGAWHDLDLSGIVPSNAKAVALYVALFATDVNQNIWFRTNGNVNTYNVSRAFTQTSLIWSTGDFIVPLDEARKIEYMSVNPTWISISITVKGWWF